MTLKSTLLFLVTLSPILAQSGPIIAGAGYTAPAPLGLAPGQVLTLFVRGLPANSGGELRTAESSAVPLPTTLAGISVAVIQGDQTFPAAISAVRQENDCPAGTIADPNCLLTSVRLQAPFEMAAPVSLNEGNQVVYPPLAHIRVDVDGRPGHPFALQPLPDNAHVLTDCDRSWDTKYGSVCNRHVYHADGTLADEKAPAKAGEIVIVYAYGLGQTSATVPTGTISPDGATATAIFGQHHVSAALQKDFVNALSSGPRSFVTWPIPGSEIAPVQFEGLAPGQLGIYQLNIQLPSSVTSYPCGGDAHSNAVLSVTTMQGTENIAFCVQS